MDKKPFTAADSLRTIEDAINEVKITKTGAAFYYVLWGMILFVYYLLHWLTIIKTELKGTIIDSYNWLLFPIGGLLSYLNKNKDLEKENYVPHLEKVYFFAFTSFAFIYAVINFASSILLSSLVITLFPLIIGSTVYMVGGISKHKPSIVGGVISMVLSVVSLLSIIEFQYLMAAFACIASLIIPGITMRKSNV
jgi:hypothetical protein